ncbi:MAG: ribosome-associated translation inhibitor RaiA [Alphaproteobacteria bacterium]|nr:ribosome-associated translation inhibitor RaiA [Alphaproteobacteria bacterium]
MQIKVSGKQVDVGESLRTHVEERLSENIPKYLDRVTQCDVVISREAHQFRADIVLNTGTHSHLIVKGRADAVDAHTAFDGAAEKIEKQLRRYKRRLTDHHKSERHEPVNMGEAESRATKYVLASRNEEEESNEEAPLIIAEKATSMETLTVSEAVMRMDLADLPALMFYNKANGRLNTVYRRTDGNISWVDPAQQEAAA